MVRSRDSEAVPETRGAPVNRQRQILIRHYNRTGLLREGREERGEKGSGVKAWEWERSEKRGPPRVPHLQI